MIKILEYGKINADEIFARTTTKYDVSATVSEIIENVKANGDKAIKEYSLKFDGADINELAVSEQEIADAVKTVEPEFLRI